MFIYLERVHVFVCRFIHFPINEAADYNNTNKLIQYTNKFTSFCNPVLLLHKRLIWFDGIFCALRGIHHKTVQNTDSAFPFEMIFFVSNQEKRLSLHSK